MFDLPPNTMFSYLSNPMFDKTDISSLPVKVLADEAEHYIKSSGKHAYPETDALKFYYLNHAFHVLKSKVHPLEPLPEELANIAEQHIRMTNDIAKRLFFYSIVIAVEEARFIPSQDQAFFDFLTNSYGSEFCDYVQKRFPGKLTDFGKLDMTCGEYAAAMVSVFAFGKWQPGYGGKGWTPIASLISDCINGNISFEAMADQAFSLCHNNGSMFNKGHLYHCYSHFIYEILDIQDSGQIPQWINENSGSKFIDKDLASVHKAMVQNFPDEVTGPVNKSLIKNSEKKREQKAQALAKKNAATWNNWNGHGGGNNAAPKANPDQKLNNILLGGLGGMKP